MKKNRLRLTYISSKQSSTNNDDPARYNNYIIIIICSSIWILFFPRGGGGLRFHSTADQYIATAELCGQHCLTGMTGFERPVNHFGNIRVKDNWSNHKSVFSQPYQSKHWQHTSALWKSYTKESIHVHYICGYFKGHKKHAAHTSMCDRIQNGTCVWGRKKVLVLA